jgi:hypothetical protein
MTSFTRTLGIRPSSLSVSLLLHVLIVLLMAAQPAHTFRDRQVSPVRHHYTVQLLRLDLPRHTPRPRIRVPVTHAVKARKARPAVGTRVKPSELAVSSAGSASPGSTAQLRKQFVMPDLKIAQPVNQTLIRSDVPAPLFLQHDVPLPAMMLVPAEILPRAPPRRFVAPSIRRAQPAKVPTVAIALAPDVQPQPEVPNGMKLVALQQMVKLPVPSAPMPLRQNETTKPMTAAPTNVQDGAAPTVSALSISENPTLPVDIFALPAADQIAAASSPHPGSGTAGGVGTGGSGAGSASKPGLGKGMGQGDTTQNASVGAASGTQHQPSGSLVASNVGSGAGNPGTAALPGSETVAMPQNIPGTTTITLPKEGQFGVVVMGSTAAAPYPESTGTLSGTMVYTVYLRVGQRKNWILQYCLPRNAGPSVRPTGTQAPPLEAPWPYHMVRPDQAGDTDYALVHGMVNTEGRFEKLSITFPEDLESKDLLLRSLKQWAFRPAKRDGVPLTVEVLLIIPRED